MIPAIEYIYDIFQFEGNQAGGFITFCNDRKAYKLSYTQGEVVELGDYMYFPCVSPDEKYVAYSTGGVSEWRDRGWEGFQDLFEKSGLQNMEEGIYIKEIETGKTAFIEFTDVSYPMEDVCMKWLE